MNTALLLSGRSTCDPHGWTSPLRGRLMSSNACPNARDLLRRLAERATQIADGMDVKHNRAHDVAGVNLYSHPGFTEDLVLIGAIREALERLAAEHIAQADEIEARLV